MPSPRGAGPRPSVARLRQAISVPCSAPSLPPDHAARPRPAEVVVDDRDVRPAEGAGTLGQAVLAQPALVVVGELVGGGLPEVDERAAREVVRRDLHRPPPLPRHPRRGPPSGARPPAPTAPPASRPPSAFAGPRARGGRVGGRSVADAACLSPAPGRRPLIG